MEQMHKMCMFVVLLAALSLPAMAVEITFASDLVNEGNSVTGTNVLVNPFWDAVWKTPPAGVYWESYALTGANQVFPPNATLPTPTAVFWEELNLPYENNTGSMVIYADDTADGWLYNSTYPNGIQLWTGHFVLDEHCASEAPGCQPGEGLMVTLTAPYLAKGVNRIVMPAYQVGGNAFGVAYYGQVTSTPQVPEPGALVLTITGVGLLVLRWRKQRRTLH